MRNAVSRPTNRSSAFCNGHHRIRADAWTATGRLLYPLPGASWSSRSSDSSLSVTSAVPYCARSSPFDIVHPLTGNSSRQYIRPLLDDLAEV